MNETICWYCERKIGYEGEKYCDVICCYCGCQNSIYDPTKQEPIKEEEEMKPEVFSGKFLKVSDVENGDLIKFTDEGVEVESTQFKYPALTMKGEPHPLANQPKKQFQIGVELGDGSEKILTLNLSSYRNLADKWGEDTINWIEKIAKVTVIPLPNGKNKMILLEPAE